MVLNIADAKPLGNSLRDTSARYCMRMESAAIIRRARLRKLIDENFGGSTTSLAQQIKKTPGQISQWLHSHRQMSEKSARAIEERCRLPAHWLDRDDVVREARAPTAWTSPPTIDAPPMREITDDRAKVLVELANRTDQIPRDNKKHIMDLIHLLFKEKQFRVDCANTILEMLKLYEENVSQKTEEAN